MTTSPENITFEQLARDHDTLWELLTGLTLAIENARDYDTLTDLIGDTVSRALRIQTGQPPSSRLRRIK